MSDRGKSTDKPCLDLAFHERSELKPPRRSPPEQPGLNADREGRWAPVLFIGLIARLFLGFWVPVSIWATGLGLIAAGFSFKALAPRLWKTIDGTKT